MVNFSGGRMGALGGWWGFCVWWETCIKTILPGTSCCLRLKNKCNSKEVGNILEDFLCFPSVCVSRSILGPRDPLSVCVCVRESVWERVKVCVWCVCVCVRECVFAAVRVWVWGVWGTLREGHITHTRHRGCWEKSTLVRTKEKMAAGDGVRRVE